MLTCCVHELQLPQRRHQQSEQQDQLRREMRGVLAKARKACLCLLLETAGRPFLGNNAASDAARLSFDYSKISSSSLSSDEWSKLKPKELEAATYQVQGHATNSGPSCICLWALSHSAVTAEWY